MGSNTELAIKEILDMLENIEFDVFIAGPAFQAGRYGLLAVISVKLLQKNSMFLY